MHIFSRLIFLAVFLMAAAAILYELMLAAALSYLLGATILYFSLTIGVFLFALGVGAGLSARLEENLLQKFLTLEVLLGILGGLSLAFIFLIYALFFGYLSNLLSAGPIFYFFYWANVAEVLFNITAFAIIFAIGALVGLELPIFTRLASKNSSLKEALAKIFFWDYAGALAGSILFPLVFLPWLGFLRTGFAIGLLNIFAAILLAFSISGAGFWRNFSRFGKALVIAGSAALVLGLFFAPVFEEFFTSKIFAGSKVILSTTSPYQQITLLENKLGGVSLFLNNEWQFESGPSEKRYHETFAHEAMNFLVERSSTSLLKSDFNILILGGGDGLLLREIWKQDSQLGHSVSKYVTLVDIDPAVTDLAKNHPVLRALNKNSMSDPRLTLLHGDAFRWLLKRPHTEPLFDAVFADFPDPVDPGLSRLYSRELYLLVKKHLSPSGILVVQANSLPSQPHEVIKKTVASAGFRTMSLHPETSLAPDEQIHEFAFVAAFPDEAYEVKPRRPASGINSIFRPSRFEYLSGLLPMFLQARVASGNEFLTRNWP